MGDAFLAVFADALAAFAVIAVAAAVLRRTRQHTLFRAVRWGVTAALVASMVAAWGMAQSDQQATWERRFTWAALAAVVALAVVCWWHSRATTTDTTHAARRSLGAIALFAITTIVLAREGMHLVLLFAIFVVQVPVAALQVTLLAASALAIAVAWAWGAYAHRLPTPVFVFVSALVLGVVAMRMVTELQSPPQTPATSVPWDRTL
jgi:high-affinity Fe2+/Pb2+ permease